jgi:hypothetical protein
MQKKREVETANDLAPKTIFVIMPSGSGDEYASKREESDFIYRDIICPAHLLTWTLSIRLAACSFLIRRIFVRGFGRWKVPARPEVFGENGEAGKDLWEG